MELADFLKARLDEDEAAAKAAPGCEWTARTEDSIAGASVYDEQWVLLYPERYDHDNALSSKPGATGPQYIQRSRDELCAHIARHGPARVLREVEATRAILALHQSRMLDRWQVCTHCRPVDPEYPSDSTSERWPCRILRAIAAVYRDHPDYRPEWAPESGVPVEKPGSRI